MKTSPLKLVALEGFEPINLPLLRRVHMPILLQGQMVLPLGVKPKPVSLRGSNAIITPGKDGAKGGNQTHIILPYQGSAISLGDLGFLEER